MKTSSNFTRRFFLYRFLTVDAILLSRFYRRTPIFLSPKSPKSICLSPQWESRFLERGGSTVI